MKGRWLLAALVAVTSCHEPLTRPVEGDPGYLSVSVASSQSNAGAVRIRLNGVGVDSLVSSHTLFSAADAEGTQVILIGSVSNGTLLRFWVPDRAPTTPITVEILEAAEAGTYAQLVTNEFSVTVSRD